MTNSKRLDLFDYGDIPAGAGMISAESGSIR